jgi:hypothetical protein
MKSDGTEPGCEPNRAANDLNEAFPESQSASYAPISNQGDIALKFKVKALAAMHLPSFHYGEEKANCQGSFFTSLPSRSNGNNEGFTEWGYLEA